MKASYEKENSQLTKKTLRNVSVATVFVICVFLIYTFPLSEITLTDISHLEKRKTDLFCMKSSKWVKSNSTKLEDLLDLVQKNNKFRKNKKWPALLFNEDLTCGVKHAYYVNNYHVKAQCDGFGLYPCCNEKEGKCGNGQNYCDCQSCTDYSKVIYPEYYKWTSNEPRCNDKIPSFKKTCSFLTKQFSSVTFIGDSLCRHLFQALLLHLTNDRKHGALKYNTDELTKKQCAYEEQFNEAYCRQFLALYWEHIKINPKFCSYEKEEPIKVQFFGYYSLDYRNETINLVKELLTETNPLIIFGLGGHNSFEYKRFINELLQPVVSHVKNTVDAKPIIIFQNIMSIGPLKFLEFSKIQGTEKIKIFNKHIGDFCRKNNILVFDPFVLTENVYSFDGTHYGSYLNEEKVRLLINGIMNYFE